MRKIQYRWQFHIYTLLIGQGISLVTSSMLQMAIIIHLTAQTASAFVLSLATMAGFLPQAVLGPFIGVMVDRLPRKTLMIGADLFIALAGGLLAVYTLMAPLPVWMVLLVLFLRSIGTAFHAPAMSAVTPLIVPEDQLVRTSGFGQAIQSISMMISPAGGALLYALWPLGGIIALDVLGALLACLTVLVVPIPEIPQKQEEKVHLIKEMQEGYQALKKHPGLFQMMWIGTVYMLIYMPINALFPLMSMEYFGGDGRYAAAAEITFAGGMLLGGVVLGLWGGFKKKTHTLALSIMLMGGALLVSGLLPRHAFPLFAALCIVMGFSGPLYGVYNVLIQQHIPPELLGRVFSLMMSLMSVAMPLGLMLSGIFANQVGVHTWFALSGGLILLLALPTLLLPAIKSIDTLDAGTQRDTDTETL